jgi:glycerophosphoryl diester phosphodiesterase
MAIPVGSALGYLLGGYLGQHFGWRQAFLIAGMPGLLAALVLFFFKDPPRGRFDAAETQSKLALLEVYRCLWLNKSYRFTVLGYAANTFVVGGVAFWMPSYLVRLYGMELINANLIFGGVTVVAGLLGTLLGGFWADRWAQRSADAYLKLSVLSAFVAALVFIGVILAKDLWVLFALIFVLEFFLFLSISPINAQIVNSVSVSYRATANAVSIFAIHLLGDAISPTLMGAISDQFNMRVAMLIVGPIGITIAGLLWLAKIILAWEAMPWPQQWRLPKDQCHRGFYQGNGLQENTLAAFKAAKDGGARMIELDVRLSKDGIAVVVHDADIFRISGDKRLVSELTAAELLRIANVPMLASVLTDSGVPELVNVELKSEGAKSDGLENAVAVAIEASAGQNRVLFSSFNPLVLRRMSKLLPQVPRALLVTNENDPKNKIYLRAMWAAFLAKPHLVHLDQAMYTEALAQDLKLRSIPVSIWTVEDAQVAKNFLARGAESIISPTPSLVG